MHTSGRVQTGYMQHHPLFGEYTLERNEMKRLRKSAIPPVSLVVVSMCRLVARHASRAAFSCTGRIDNMRHHTCLRKRDSSPMLGPTHDHMAAVGAAPGGAAAGASSLLLGRVATPLSLSSCALPTSARLGCSGLDRDAWDFQAASQA